MLVLVDLFEFEIIVAPELGVASSHGVGGFQQVVTEIAVAGFDHLGMLGFKITGLVFVPDKACKFSNRGLKGKTVDITNFSDDTSRINLANAGDGGQGVWDDFKLLLNSLVQNLDLFLQCPHGSDRDGHSLVHSVVHCLGQTVKDPLAAACTALAVASGSTNLPRPASEIKVVSSLNSAFARSSTVSKCSMRVIVVALVF